LKEVKLLGKALDDPVNQKLLQTVNSLTWYHTIDLGGGILTPGFYDHRPYLDYYGLPKNINNRSALDIGAASGFFTFELEKRGAVVTATDLPTWLAHDFGPLYRPDLDPEQADRYLHGPFEFAHETLGSSAQRQLINIYDISPDTTGMFDLVFCGSVLLHLSDPVRAMWCIQSVTREAAIIATVIQPLPGPEPQALFIGQRAGDGWWLPNRAAFEAMIECAGFKGWEWFSEFRLDYRDGGEGATHAVIRAWNTEEKPALLSDTDLPAQRKIEPLVLEDPEILRLRSLVSAYERLKCVRFMRWLHQYRQRISTFIRRTTP